MAVTGDAALQATKAEIIAAMVQKELISQSVLASTIMDVSRFAVKGAETVSFPKAGSFTVENRASGAQATIQNLTFAKDTMTLGFRATVSWLIDPMDELESVIDVDAEYALRAARSHAVYLDNQIIAELETVGDTTTTAGNISDAVILEMRAKILNQKADRRLLRLAISPDQEAIMLGINKFVTADNYGTSIVPSGALGTIYGIPVFITPELDTQQYFLYEQEGIAMAFQRGPMLDERKAPEYGAGAMLKTLDQKFGVKGMLLGQQGVGATESPLVVKDNNP
jgi:nucleoid DNA-binding protein